MNIHWSKGLFRLWLVVTALWIGAIGVATWQDHYSGRGLTDEEVGITPQMKSMTWEGAELGKPPPFELTVPVPTFDPTKPYEVLRPPEGDHVRVGASRIVAASWMRRLVGAAWL